MRSGCDSHSVTVLIPRQVRSGYPCQMCHRFAMRRRPSQYLHRTRQVGLGHRSSDTMGAWHIAMLVAVARDRAMSWHLATSRASTLEDGLSGGTAPQGKGSSMSQHRSAEPTFHSIVVT